MRLTLVAMLVVCGSFCTGCESLSKTARNFPGRNPAISEQLANDQKRREAADKQIAQTTPPASENPVNQKANFAPSSDPAAATLLQAKQAEQARQNQVAKGLYEQVLQQQPQHAEAHHRLGVLADQDGRYPEAQQHYQLALQQQPQNASLLSDIGYSLYSQDRLEEAEQYLTSALQLHPENQYARNNLAQVYGRRAQQTGSAADYKLAQEQFALALGPQGAEQQMQQLFPHGSGATGERRGLLNNPFKKRGGAEKNPGRMANNLEAPDPKATDGNAELLRQMEQIRQQMVKNGEIPPTRPSNSNPRQPNSGGLPENVPFEQVNSVLSQIDHDASQRQANALRSGYPNIQRGNSAYPNDRNAPNGIERTSGTEYADGSPNAPSYRGGPGGNATGASDRFATSMPILSGPPGPPGGRNDYAANRPDASTMPPANPNLAEGQYGAAPQGLDPTDSPGWNRDASGMATSWPDRGTSPTQFDARGQIWDGQTIINNPGAGNSGLNNLPTRNARNLAYDSNDPTYNSGNGRSFGAQRPNGGATPVTNGRGRPGTFGGRDSGRDVAAELGLDAGMGDMFPGGPGDQGMSERNQFGNGVFQAGGEASMYGDSMGQQGPAINGMRNVAPADYNSFQQGYQNQGYNDQPGNQNYGNAGGDSAPWNQPGMSSRNSRPPVQNQYGTQNGNGGQAQGRFAPSRQSPAARQEFGGPPMYYDR